MDIAVVTAVGPADVGLLSAVHSDLHGQVGVEWQWVVCLDGDASVEAPEELARDPRVTVVRTGVRSGPAAARNCAATAVSAPLLRNLDSDDLLGGPDTLQQTVQVFRDVPWAQFMAGPMIDVDESGHEATFGDPLPAGRIDPGVLFRHWEGNDRFGAVHPTSLCLRTDTFFRYGGYPALPGSEDTALLFHINRTEPGWFADFYVTRHWKHSASITASGWFNDPDNRAMRDEFVIRTATADIEGDETR